MKRAARMLASIGLCGIAACSTTPGPVQVEVAHGAVGVQDLTAQVAPAARIELADNENFLPPLPEPGNAVPAYPPELLERRLPPQAVCLRVSISETGTVTEAAPFVRLPDCTEPGAGAGPFVVAARDTVAGWRYDPAVRCVFEHAPRPDYPTCVDARETPQAVSLTYRFVFEQQDGRGTVRVVP